MMLVLGLGIVGCQKEPEPIKVAKITLNATSLNLTEGETGTIIATISPSNAENQKVLWTTSNPSVATVTDGIIYAIKAGSATITATSDDNGKTATCMIIVTKRPVPVTGIVLDKDRVEMFMGEIITLTASVLPNDATNKKIIWRNSDETVIRLENGKVTALEQGVATVYARTEEGGYSASCDITVKLNEDSYLTFETLSGTNHLKITNIDASLFYSTDTFSWFKCEENQSIEFGKESRLYLRGEGNNVGGSNPICKFNFTEDAKVRCIGNIMCLLDYKQLGETIKRDYCFSDLFSSCVSLVEVPKLPSTELSRGCYEKMFYGCSSLTAAPELPATQIAERCYSEMFKYCTSLTEAPDLPAMEMKWTCYYKMFEGCSSLVKASRLPATQLETGCYSEMFKYCTSLTETPDLPAAQLSDVCYSYMFYGCTSLKKTPKLPATQLAELCYFYMFKDCISLTEAPELPAKSLADACYSYMFEGCTSLIKAPELPATQLVESCYSGMFSNCKSLNYVKAMFIDVLPGALTGWLSIVSSTGTFVKNIAATWDNSGIVPDEWTIEHAEQ